MIKSTNDNRFLKFFQPKLFYINKDIDKDDPVRLLSAILEEMDFSNLMQVFPNKTKVHPVNMFTVVIHELFTQFVDKLFKLSEISTKTIYIDGTKIEAYANKYSFVWKKSTLKYKE